MCPTSDTVDAPLQNELLMNAVDLEAESWSLAVEPQFCKMQEKRIIKRQDVIYGQLKQSSSLKHVVQLCSVHSCSSFESVFVLLVLLRVHADRAPSRTDAHGNGRGL